MMVPVGLHHTVAFFGEQFHHLLIQQGFALVVHVAEITV